MKSIIIAILIAIPLCTYANEDITEEESYFQLSFIPDIALYPEKTEINGLALNFWGKNPQRSLNIGIANGSSSTSAGLSIALFMNYAENYSGAQIAPFNWVEKRFKGSQIGLANYAKRLDGGVQIGFINYASELNSGLQIGLFNVIRNTEEWFDELPEEAAPALIFVNWRF